MVVEVSDAAFYHDGESPTSEAPPAAQKLEIPKLDISLVLWLMLFVFGGGLLALYYAGIGYFPEVSWQDALTYLALMTIVGGSLLVAYSFLLFVPGAIWSEFLIFDEQLHQVLMMAARRWEPCVWSVTKRILFPFALFMSFCHFLLYEHGPAGFVPMGSAASLVAVSILLGKDLREGLELAATRGAGDQTAVLDTSTVFRNRIFVGFGHAPLLAVFMAKAIFDVRPGPGVLWTAALFPLVSCAAVFVDNRIGRRRLGDKSTARLSSQPLDRHREAASGKSEVPDEWSILCRAILAFGSAALVSLMALWFFHRIYSGGESRTPSEVPSEVPLGLLLLCTLVVIVTNLSVSVLFHKHRRSALMASFLAALLLLGAGQLLGTKSEATLPAKIMEKFGFGGLRATLVLTEKGGRLLCQQAIPVQFEQREIRDKGVAASSQALVPGVGEETLGSKKNTEGREEESLLARTVDITILSRLGSEYLLRYEGQKRTIALPKGEVVSWSTSPQDQELSIQDDCKLPKVPGQL